MVLGSGILSMQSYYDVHIKGDEMTFSEEVQRRMDYGSVNEINATATLIALFMPFFLPHSKLVEEGARSISAIDGCRQII